MHLRIYQLNLVIGVGFFYKFTLFFREKSSLKTDYQWVQIWIKKI